MHGRVDVGIAGLYVFFTSEQLQEALSEIRMMSGTGRGEDDCEMMGSVGSAAHNGGGMVMYDTGRSPLVARRMTCTENRVSVRSLKMSIRAYLGKSMVCLCP